MSEAPGQVALGTGAWEHAGAGLIAGRGSRMGRAGGKGGEVDPLQAKSCKGPSVLRAKPRKHDF